MLIALLILQLTIGVPADGNRQIGNSASPIAVAYGRRNLTAAWFRTYSAGTWSNAAALPSISREPWWSVLRNCPARNELAYGALNGDMDVKVAFWNGSSWSPVTTCTTSTAINSDRAFDMAYEQTSGRAIIVYWNSALKRLGYRMYSGVSVSSEFNVTPPTNKDIRYIVLFPRSGTDQMLLFTLNTDNDLNVYTWDGFSFSSPLTLETNMGTATFECFSAAYESNSGRAVLVYREGDLATPRYRTWNGSSWSSEFSVPSIGAKPRYLRLEPNPNSNEIAFASLDDKNDINLNVWNGSSWGTNLEVTVAAKYGDRRCYDLAYEPSTGHAVVAYSKGGQNRLNYRVWSGSSWSAEGIGTDLANECRTIQLRRGLTTGQIHLVATTDDSDLVYSRWDGSSWSPSRAILDLNISEDPHTEQFMMVVPIGHKILSWTEVSP